MPLVRICSNQITLLDQMQQSGTAKHVPAKKRIAGEQRPGSSQVRAMLDQWKKSRKRAGNISQQCIYLQPSEEKYVHSEWGFILWTVRNLWGVAKGQ